MRVIANEEPTDCAFLTGVSAAMEGMVSTMDLGLPRVRNYPHSRYYHRPLIDWKNAIQREFWPSVSHNL